MIHHGAWERQRLLQDAAWRAGLTEVLSRLRV